MGIVSGQEEAASREETEPNYLASFPPGTLLLPSLLALVTVAVWGVPPAVDVEVPRSVTAGLMGATYLVSLFAFVVMYSDMAEVRETVDGWSPQLWRYAVPGTVGAAAILVVSGILPYNDVTNVRYYVGVLITAVFLSPAVVGPIYSYQRARNVG